MGRLIDDDMIYDMLANKLIWLMNISDAVYLEVGNDIRQSIDELSTAYDIDEVVEQLEENYSYDVGNLKMISVDKAIEIVKGGE